MMPAVSRPSAVPSWQIVVPVRGGTVGKTRLTAIEGRRLSVVERRELALAMAADTVRAAVASGCGPVSVLTADEAVAAMARSCGADVLTDAGQGLNAELYASLTPLQHGTGVAVLLGDVPAARGDDLREALRLAQGVGRAYLPDWEGTGTALVAFAPEVADRAFAFGPESARRHRELGLAEVGLGLARLRCDVDTPRAWERAAGLGLGEATSAVRHRLLADPPGQRRGP